MSYRASVIITTFNQENFISKTIDSVLESVDTNTCKIIVINDGSTDSTYDLLQSSRYEDVKIIHRNNGGPSAALNDGLKECDGEYIFFLGGDDLFMPNRFKAQITKLRNSNADLCFGLPYIIDEEGMIIEDSVKKEFFTDLYNSRITNPAYQLFYGGNFLCAPTACIHTKLLSKIGNFSEGLLNLQDYEYWIRAAAIDAKFSLIENRVIKYRARKNNKNLSSNVRNPRCEVEYSVVMDEFFEKFDIENIKKEFGLAINYELLKNCNEEVYNELLICGLYLQHERKDIRATGLRKLVKLLNKAKRSQLSDYYNWKSINVLMHE